MKQIQEPWTQNQSLPSPGALGAPWAQGSVIVPSSLPVLLFQHQPNHGSGGDLSKSQKSKVHSMMDADRKRHEYFKW